MEARVTHAEISAMRRAKEGDGRQVKEKERERKSTSEGKEMICRMMRLRLDYYL